MRNNNGGLFYQDKQQTNIYKLLTFYGTGSVQNHLFTLSTHFQDE